MVPFQLLFRTSLDVVQRESTKHVLLLHTGDQLMIVSAVSLCVVLQEKPKIPCLRIKQETNNRIRSFM